MLAASITATALVVSNDAAARPASAHRSTGLVGLAGDLSGAAGPNASERQANEQLPVDELSRESRQYESEVSAAQQARAAEQAARRAVAIRRAKVLAAQRQAAARSAAAARAARAAQQARAAQTPPAQNPSADGQPKSTTPATPYGSPQQIATAMLADFGWSSGEFGCLNELWERESGWNAAATNPYSGAYGIPQALPGAKMASAGADWETNPATQIKWGLGYIKATYGSPCGAWSHETAYGWY